MPTNAQQSGESPRRMRSEETQQSRVRVEVTVTTDEMDGTHAVIETGDSLSDALYRCRVSATRSDAIESDDIQDVKITEGSFERVSA